MPTSKSRSRKSPPKRPAKAKPEAVDGEIITEEEQRRDQVRAMTMRFLPADYIARQLQVPLDEFLEAYSDLISDTIAEMTAEFAAVMTAKALGRDTEGDVKAAAFMLARLNFEPGEIRIVGARNQSRPLIIDGRSAEGIRQPALTPAIQAAIQAAENSKPRRKSGNPAS